MSIIQGKLALVTGGSSGIGEATSKLLAQKGAKVILLARQQDKLNKVATAIKDKGGQAEIVTADLADMDKVMAVADDIHQKYGTPDLLINNAGMGKWRFMTEVPAKAAITNMNVPYFSAYAITHAFLPAMVKRNSGHILNVNSPLCKMIWRGTASYTAVRWALRAFSKALAADLAHTNINVSHYIAGAVNSPYWEHNSDSRNRFPKIATLVPAISSDQAAAGLLYALEHNKREYVYPLAMRLVLWQHALMPWLVNALMRIGAPKYPT